MYPAAGHEEAEHLERLIVKDFRNELKGHKERLQQSHRVRNMLDIMQERAKKLVRHDLGIFLMCHAACMPLAMYLGLHFHDVAISLQAALPSCSV